MRRDYLVFDILCTIFEILPYHSLGNYKYDNLGLSKYKNLYATPDEKDIEKVKDIIKSFAIEVIDFK